MIEDIMQELGYNKRRDKDVKRLIDKPIDWEVLSTGSPKIAVKVFALGDEINNDELKTAMDYSNNRNFSIFIVTNGEALTICRRNKVKHEYAEVCDISLLEKLSETKEAVLDAISKDGFNLQLIDDVVSKNEMSSDKVIEVIENNLNKLALNIASIMGDSSESMVKQCAEVLKDLFTNKSSESDSIESENTQRVETSQTVDISVYTSEIEQLKEEIESQKAEIEELKSNEQTSIDKESAEAHEEVDITEYTNKIAELQNIITELTQKDEQLEAELAIAKESETEVVDTTELEERLNTALADKDNLEKQVETLTSEKEQLETEVNTLKSSQTSSGATVSDEEIQAEILSYREKIQELSVKVSEAEEAKTQAEEKLKEMEGIMSNMSGSEKKRAEELLAVIEDNKELPRSYVAVINSELLQYDEIHTFAGRILQRLYEIKGLEASRFIFDGTIFKIEHNAVRNDLFMDSKTFDLNLDGIHEDGVLNKLRVVFSHFNDIVFECKKIGTIGVTYIDQTEQEEVPAEIETAKDNLEDAVEVTEDVEETTEQTNTESEIHVSLSKESFDDNEFTEETEEDNMFKQDENEGEGLFITEDEADADENAATESSENSFQFENDFNANNEQSSENEMFEQSNNEFNQFDQFSEPDQFGDEQYDNNNSLNALLCSQLAQIDMLIWNDEPIQFNNIKYIGSSNVTFDINSHSSDMTNEQLLCRSVDAVLALAVAYGDFEVVNKLRKIDFRQVSEYIHLFTEEFRDCPKINGTRFVVSGIESIQKVAYTLVNICNALNIDMSDIFMFFDATTTSQQIVDDWGYEEDAIQLREFTNYNSDGNDIEATAVLRGDIFSNIMITKNSLQAHRLVFRTTLAVKTQYFARQVNNSTDFNESIVEIVKKSMENGRTPNFNAVGNVIGESYRLISTNPNEVNENATQMNIEGLTVFISAVEPWQIPLSLIKAHTALMANTGVAVKVNVNTSALDFFLNEYEVAEPSLSLAVASFARYIESCIR
jgi:hypothetical protein